MVPGLRYGAHGVLVMTKYIAGKVSVESERINWESRLVTTGDGDAQLGKNASKALGLSMGGLMRVLATVIIKIRRVRYLKLCLSS